MRGLRTRAIVRWVVLAAASAVFGSAVVAGAVAGPHAARRPLGTIAFLRHPEGALTGDVGGPSLFVIKADGTGLRRLTSPDSEVYGFAWSPDGSRIAYTDRSSLWLVRRDGSGRRRLFARRDLKSLMPTWSPDGKSIGLYVPRRPPARQRLAGYTSSRLTEARHGVSDLTISAIPRGRPEATRLPTRRPQVRSRSSGSTGPTNHGSWAVPAAASGQHGRQTVSGSPWPAGIVTVATPTSTS